MGVNVKITQMSKFIKEAKLYIKFKIKQFIETRFFLFVLGCIIGSTTVYIILVGSPYYNWVKEGIEITEVYRVSAEEMPHVGEVVSAGSLQEVSLAIPAKGSIEELIAHFFKTDAEDAIAIMNCESSGNQFAFNPTNGSNDRGYWQISKKYHPEVSDDCAYDPTCSTIEAKRIFDEAGDWSPWMCKGVIN